MKVCFLPPGARCGPYAVKRLSLDNRGYNRLKKNLDGRGNILKGPRRVGNLGLLDESQPLSLFILILRERKIEDRRVDCDRRVSVLECFLNRFG